MDLEVIHLLDEAISLEYHVSELYNLFSNSFEPDRYFWWQLAIEEKNHASLLKSGKELYKFNEIPLEIFPEKINQLKESINKVSMHIKSFSSEWSRKKAFDVGIELENSAGELHYQNFMNSKIDSEIAEIFHKLNRNDYDHARRITEYKQKQGIE